MTYKFAAWLLVSCASSMAVASSYTIHNGDNDWAIAHRLHISLKQLHQENPDVNWGSIQPGQKLHIPSEASSESHHSRSRSSESEHVSGGGHYTVREDDNDWTIAAKLGITQRTLHRLNPDVRWNRIHPGEKLVVPASVATKEIHHISTRYARVNGDNVTLRRGPSTDEEKVTSVDEGTEARVLDREHGWYKLRFPKGTVAWVRGDFLSSVRRSSSESYASSSSHRRSHSSGTYARSSRRHHRNSGLPLVASEIGDGKLLQTAASYLGTRYRTGGTSRSSGFDCSGFTSTVLRKNGIHVPRTAHEQSGVGQRVGKEGLVKGDLVFFRTNRSTRVNHVGMYIGNGKFIHASSGGGRVQVNSLSDGYYSRRFAGARRVVKSSGSAKHTTKKKS